MTLPEPLLFLPLDDVPRRTMQELLFIGPDYPNWLRRNHEPVDTSDPNGEITAIYSLYTKLVDNGVTHLFRIMVAPRGVVQPDADGRASMATEYGVLLARWDFKAPQTARHIPFDVLTEQFYTLGKSRNDHAARLVSTVHAYLDPPPLRTWIDQYP